MLRNRALTLLLLSLCLSITFCARADRQSLTSIELQAEAFISAHTYQSPYPVRFLLSELDPRLKLKTCHEDLDIRFSQPSRTMGNTALTIRCSQPVAWKLHLPASIAVFDDVAISANPLTRGQIIDSQDIQYRKKNISLLKQGYYRKGDVLSGLEARRNLASGQVLTPASLQPRKLVSSGQRVTIMLNIDGLKIKTSGQALSSASMGQIVKVRNTRSNKIVEAVVTGEGQVKVQL